MDWKFFATTAIALAAIWISWRARKEVQRASKATFELQSRLEHYEHFPIIHLSVIPEGDKVKIVIKNTSPKNSVSSYKIRLILRITAGNATFSISKDNYVHQGSFLGPNSTENISPDEINDCIAHAIGPLKKYPSDQNHFVLRAYAECIPPHSKSKPIFEEGVGFFTYEEDQLKLTPEPK
ncbi:hypothetical protein [Pseudomonas zeae]|uniref:hypothetical protein n=1 Tax=Pseudomonas zeae TaxID=2745510 RepID=UPI0039E13483